MDVSLYQAAAAMNATERWQNMIAQNLAVASAPGGRKQEISFSAVAAGMSPYGSDYVIPAASTVTNFQQGELRPTNRPLDFALDGKGFFTIQLPNGQQGYTRNGEFHLNAQGELVSQEGYPVLTDSGPVQVDPNSGVHLTISSTGQVSQGKNTLGKLQVTNFNNPELLTAVNGGLFLANNPKLQPSPAISTQVRQGFVESSNSSPTLEMAGLITAMRMFQSNEKVMQMQSRRMSRTITDLGGS